MASLPAMASLRRCCTRRGAPAARVRGARDESGEGSCGGLQGTWELDGTGEERLSEDQAGDSRVTQAADGVEVRRATRDEHVDVVALRERGEEPRVGRGAAVGQ